MKKELKFAFLSVIALTGTVGFLACSSSDEIIENPDYDPETGTVKTEFVFNVAQPSDRTRQSSSVVGNTTFQGINDMYLFCFDNEPSSSSTFDEMHSFALDGYDKPDPLLNGNETNNSSKVYTLFIPTNTQNFLFYATANDAEKNNYPIVYGKLKKSYIKNNAVKDITFNLCPIEQSEDEITNSQTVLLGILNGLVNVSISSPVSLKWSDTSNTNNTELFTLGQAYNNFINQASDADVRQGSALAIKNMVGDLFDAVNEIYTKSSDKTAIALAEAILQKIAQSFTVSKYGASPVTYSWSNSYIDGTPASVYNFPQQFPDGCAILVFNNGQFSYSNVGNSLSSVSVDYTNITYPAELMYYCNSGLWQSSMTKQASDYPNSASEWVTYDWKSNNWNDQPVSPATYAVAMKENITYGVAQLKSIVQRNSENVFIDNANTVTGGAVADNVFDGTDVADDNAISFSLSGILIGGQPGSSQFEFLPAGTNFNRVIYDSSFGAVMDLPANDNTRTLTNYTLVLDNYTPSTSGQDVVYIALELTANRSFYGLSGYVKSGQRFYLIGKLDPETLAADEKIDWQKQTSFQKGDTGYGIDRVFVRDAVTTATFTIGKDALKRAYSTVPDMRSTQMLFGLSVDLAWKAGLKFNVIIN